MKKILIYSFLVVIVLIFLNGCNNDNKTVVNNKEETAIQQNIDIENSTTKKELTEQEKTAKEKADKIVAQLNNNKLTYFYIITDNNLINVNYSCNEIALTIIYNNYELDSIYLRTTETTDDEYWDIAVSLALLDELNFTTNEIVDATMTIHCITEDGQQNIAQKTIKNFEITSSKSDYINTVLVKSLNN